jgi:hypothetical protein
MSSEFSDYFNPAAAGAVLECDPGVIRLFGLTDIKSRGCRRGFADPEYGHNWNHGFDPTLVLSVEGEIGAATLVIGGEPFVTRSQPVQDLTVYVNGYRAGFWRLVDNTNYSLRIEIEPEWWFLRDARAILKVVFHLPNSVRPGDIGEGEDGRELGFCFRTLLLEPLERG